MIIIHLQAAWIIDVNRPVKGWPTAGAIVFDNYSVRYREGLDLVLKKITCNIKGGERVSTKTRAFSDFIIYGCDE